MVGHIYPHSRYCACVGKPETDFQVGRPQFVDIIEQSGIWKKERKIHESILDLKLLCEVLSCYSAEQTKQENQKKKKKVCNNLNLKVNFDLIEFSGPSVFDFCIYLYIQTLEEWGLAERILNRDVNVLTIGEF